jgi:diguanylate cyclase (GGDEF)-like protein
MEAMKRTMSPEQFREEFARKNETSPAEASAFAQAVGEDKSLRNVSTRHTALFSWAAALAYGARYAEAEKIIKSFIFDYEKYPFLPLYIDCFGLLGTIQFYKKRFHLSVYYDQQALSLAEEKKAVERYSELYSNLSAPYHELKEDERCLLYLDKALAYVEKSSNPSSKLSILYNRSGTLASLGRYGEAKEAIREVEELAKTLPTPPFFGDFLPLCEAEIDLALHQSVDLRGIARKFLANPYQNIPDYYSFVLDEDISLCALLRKNGLPEESALYLEQVEKIQKSAPSLTTAIFLAKTKASLAEEEGDAPSAGKHYAELAHLYEEQNEGYNADFEEITKLHFDFVRLTNAYQKAERRARHFQTESDTDALTGIPNRRALEKEKKRFPLLAKKEAYFALALLDYDHFKSINDGYGYQVGDAALRLGGQFFKGFRAPDLRLFRYGGDEFLFALPVKDPAAAKAFFLQIQKGVEGLPLHSSEGNPLRLSCSIGYALFRGDYEGFAPALKVATEAIHSAKKAGPGTIVSLVCP